MNKGILVEANNNRILSRKKCVNPCKNKLIRVRANHVKNIYFPQQIVDDGLLKLRTLLFIDAIREEIEVERRQTFNYECK